MFRLMEGSSWDSRNNLRERIPRLPLRHTMPARNCRISGLNAERKKHWIAMAFFDVHTNAIKLLSRPGAPEL